MSIQVKLLIDDMEVNVLSFNLGFHQNSDTNNRYISRPIFTGLNLVIETRKDLNLADWAFAENQVKQLELHIYPRVLGGRTRKLYFYDCHLVKWNNLFSSTGSHPMSETLGITCAGVRDDQSSAEYSAYWRTSYPFADAEPTTIAEETEPRIIRQYITNRDDEELDEYQRGDKIYYVIESEHMTGEKVDIRLDNKEVDFIYRNKRLKDDTIIDYLIGSDIDKIPLEVIPEDYED